MKTTAYITAAVLFITAVSMAQPADEMYGPRPGRGHGWVNRPEGQRPMPPANRPMGFRPDRGRRPMEMQQGAGRMRQRPMSSGGSFAQLRQQIAQLNLTEEQKEQIRTVFKDNRDALRAAHQAVREARQAIYKIALEDGSEEAIRNAAGELADKVAEEAILMAKVRGSLREVLTDEQKQQLETLKEKPRSRQPARRRPESGV